LSAKACNCSLSTENEKTHLAYWRVGRRGSRFCFEI
jgi:hypothetical protein